MEIIRLIFVRHGEAVISQAGTPRMLTPVGISQAHDVARVLAERTIAKMWSSSMARAEQTAAVIGEALGLPVLLDSRLRERQEGMVSLSHAHDQDQGSFHAVPFP